MTLVERGLVPGRNDAQELIAAARVLVNGAVADKPGRLIAPADNLVVLGPPPRFVSRAGEKLDAALDHFDVSVSGCRMLDCGASTGGFTDCLLQRGAVSVVALDVGYGQLHPRIRHDSRVVVLERTNIRMADVDTVGGAIDGAVADVSFISLTMVIPVLVGLCKPEAPMVLLVKPQFEAGRAEVSAGRGVITDPQVHETVRQRIDGALVDAGCRVHGWMTSPLLGGRGNLELLVHATVHATAAA